MARRQQPSHDQFMAACNAAARQRLLNRRIVEVCYLNPDECRRLMWDRTKSGEEFVLPELNL